MVSRANTGAAHNARVALELAEREAESALERLENARRRLDIVTTTPEEPPVGSVIKFRVQYPRSENTVYEYLAMRAQNEHWYRTGHTDGMTWDQMVDLMLRDVTAKRLGIGFFLFNEKGKGRWVGRNPEGGVE